MNNKITVKDIIISMPLSSPIPRGIAILRSSLRLLRRSIAILRGLPWNDGFAVGLTICRFHASGGGFQFEQPIHLKGDYGLPD